MSYIAHASNEQLVNDVPLVGPSSSQLAVRSDHLGAFIACADGLLIVFGALCGSAIYQRLISDGWGNVDDFAWIGVLNALLFISVANARGLYNANALMLRPKQLRAVASSWLLVMTLLSGWVFVLKLGETLSRGSTIVGAVFTFALLLAFRYIMSNRLVRAVQGGIISMPRAILIGDEPELVGSSPINAVMNLTVCEVGRFTLASGTQEIQTPTMAQQLAMVDRAIEHARESNADLILLALRWGDTARRRLISERLRKLPRPVLLLPDRFVRAALEHTVIQFGPAIAVQLQRAPLSHAELAVKRSFDLVAAAIMLILCSPLLVFAALAVKLDLPGPVLFRQRRKGFNGKVFTLYKLRSMNVLEDGDFIQQARRSDPRVTRFGRMLRMHSIDELPQLLNVLRGHMSLVGPRPHALAHDNEYEELIADYALRQHVKPGITGWAQIHGHRGETPRVELMQRRVEYDRWYINNWSFWLDLKILVRTCLQLLRPRNAY